LITGTDCGSILYALSGRISSGGTSLLSLEQKRKNFSCFTLTPSSGRTEQDTVASSHIFGILGVWTIFYFPTLLVLSVQISELFKVKQKVVKIIFLVCNALTLAPSSGQTN